MYKRLLLGTGLLFTSASITLAQSIAPAAPRPTCGAQTFLSALTPEQRIYREQLENFTRDYVSRQEAQRMTPNTTFTTPTNDNGVGNPPGGGGGTVLTYTIPVVFHVLYSTSDPRSANVSDTQINAELKILNDDFARQNADANQTPTNYVSAAGASSIKFVLAARDPKNDCTSGIERREISGNGIYLYDRNGGTYTPWSDPTYGLKAWDTNHFLNVWVCAFARNNNNTLYFDYNGLAWSPGTAPAGEDGIAIQRTAFASSTPTRVLTHEAGHYFNLYHLCGPTDVSCGDDQVSDTPPQQGYYRDANNIVVRNLGNNFECVPNLTSNCTGSPTYDMYTNYMDAAPCKNMFTAGQVTRMEATLQTGGPRSGLLVAPAPVITTLASSRCGGFTQRVSIYKSTCYNASSHTFTFDPVDPNTTFSNGSTSSITTTNNLDVDFTAVSGEYTKTLCVKANYANGTSSDIACQTFRVHSAAPATPTAKVYFQGQAGGGTCTYGIKVPFTARADDFKVSYTSNSTTGTVTSIQTASTTGDTFFPFQFSISEYVSVIVEARNSCGSTTYKANLFIPAQASPCATPRPAILSTSTSAPRLQTAAVLFPNPAQGELTISGLSEQTKAVVRNAVGSTVRTFNLPAGTTTVRLDGIATGLYIIDLQGDTSQQRLRLSVARP